VNACLAFISLCVVTLKKYFCFVSYQKLSKSDNWFSSYSRKCRGYFSRHMWNKLSSWKIKRILKREGKFIKLFSKFCTAHQKHKWSLLTKLILRWYWYIFCFIVVVTNILLCLRTLLNNFYWENKMTDWRFDCLMDYWFGSQLVCPASRHLAIGSR